MSLIPARTWVVVADGRTVRLLNNVGSETALKLHQEPAPSLENNDAGPSGAQPRDNDTGEAVFVKQLADWLNRQALANRFEHLVLVTDASTLGEIRPQLHKEVQARTLAEIAKDWTNMPLADIEKALDALRI